MTLSSFLFFGGFLPVVFFVKSKNIGLRITKSSLEKNVLFRTGTNGSSELMTNISMSVVNILYNYQLLKFAGENGVAAYGVIMYVNFIFVAVYIGYSIGVAPIVGYNYGAGTSDELKNVFRKSISFNIVAGIIMTISAVLLSGFFAKIFVGYDKELYEMTRLGFAIYSISFLIMGINIFASAFFTALGNGGISALISFLRTLLFQMVAVLVLPIFFELNGIWMAIVVAESCAIVVSSLFFVTKRKRYGY